jgi:WD40 repeat protein
VSWPFGYFLSYLGPQQVQDDKGSAHAQGISLQHQIASKTGPFLYCWPQCTSPFIEDGSVACFDMRTNSPIYRQSIHKGSVNCLKVVEDKQLLISCSASGSIIVQSLPDFKQVLTINAKDMVFYV